MGSEEWFHHGVVSQLYDACKQVADAWGKVALEKQQDQLCKFLGELDYRQCCQLFSLSKSDMDYLVKTKSPWQESSLNQLKSKLYIHVRSAREACVAYDHLGYWPCESNPDIVMLNSLEAFLEEYVGSIDEITRLVLDGKTTRAPQISLIDTRLFAACSLLQDRHQTNSGLRQVAQRVVAEHLTNHLMGNGVAFIEDPANMFWAVSLALSDNDILKEISGIAGDALTRKCNLVRRALSMPRDPADHPKQMPLELTPEIYKGNAGLRMKCFIMINALAIQNRLANDHALRRNPEHAHDWDVMDSLNDMIDNYWIELFECPDRLSGKLNLYFRGLVSRTAVTWLAHARTWKRWKVMETAFFSDDTEMLSAQEIKAVLEAKTSTKMLTADRTFAEDICRVVQELKTYLEAQDSKHPFVVAITGAPGTGKSTLAQQLFAKIAGCKGQVRHIKPLNLSTAKPADGCDWWTFIRENDAYGAADGFQAIIFDEADSERDGNGPSFWYQWLLAPLWDPWRELNPAGGKTAIQEYPTVIFVIGSRNTTLYSWYTEAITVHKGPDFVSRIDTFLDFPPFSPEDQLLLAAHLIGNAESQKRRYSGISRDMALIICRARLEYSARTLESLVKHCRKAPDNPWSPNHLLSDGPYSSKGLLLTTRQIPPAS